MLVYTNSLHFTTFSSILYIKWQRKTKQKQTHRVIPFCLQAVSMAVSPDHSVIPVSALLFNLPPPPTPTSARSAGGEGGSFSLSPNHSVIPVSALLFHSVCSAGEWWPQLPGQGAVWHRGGADLLPPRRHPQLHGAADAVAGATTASQCLRVSGGDRFCYCANLSARAVELPYHSHQIQRTPIRSIEGISQDCSFETLRLPQIGEESSGNRLGQSYTL